MNFLKSLAVLMFGLSLSACGGSSSSKEENPQLGGIKQDKVVTTRLVDQDHGWRDYSLHMVDYARPYHVQGSAGQLVSVKTVGVPGKNLDNRIIILDIFGNELAYSNQNIITDQSAELEQAAYMLTEWDIQNGGVFVFVTSWEKNREFNLDIQLINDFDYVSIERYKFGGFLETGNDVALFSVVVNPQKGIFPMGYLAMRSKIMGANLYNPKVTAYVDGEPIVVEYLENIPEGSTDIKFSIDFSNILLIEGSPVEFIFSSDVFVFSENAGVSTQFDNVWYDPVEKRGISVGEDFHDIYINFSQDIGSWIHN